MKKTIILIIAMLMVTGCSSAKKVTEEKDLKLSIPEEITLSKEEESNLDSYIENLDVNNYLEGYEIDKYKLDDGSCHIHLRHGDMVIYIGFTENIEFDSIGYFIVGEGQTNSDLQEKAIKDLIYCFLMINDDISKEEAESGLSAFVNQVQASFITKSKKSYNGKIKFKADFNYDIRLGGTSVLIIKDKT